MSALVKIFNSISYDEREKKKVRKYKEKVREYSEMDKDELEMKYIYALADYEHRKTLLIATVGAFILSILTDVWKYFSNVLQKLVVMIYTDSTDAEVLSRITFPIAATITAVIIGIILVILWDMFRSLKAVTIRKLFIEEMMEKRKRCNEI